MWPTTATTRSREVGGLSRAAARTASDPSCADTGWTRSTRCVDALEGRIARHDTAIAALRGEPTPPPAPTMTSTAIATPPTQAPPRTAPGSAEPGAARPGGRAAPSTGSGSRSARLAGCRTPRTTVPVRPARPRGLPPPRGVPASRASSPRPRTGYLSQGVQDQQAFEWYFGATAHNLATLSNPLFTDLQNYPAGVNLMANAAVLGLGRSAGAGHPARRAAADLPPRRAARAGAHGIRLVLAVPAVAAGAPARRGRSAPASPASPPASSRTPTATPTSSRSSSSPLIVDRVLRLVARRPPVRDGVMLGLLAAWQVFIGEEALLLAAIGTGRRRRGPRGPGALDLRRLLPGLAIGAAVCLAIVAIPLWWQFAGPAELLLDLAPTVGERPRPALGPGHPQHRRRPVGLGRALDEPHRGELLLRRPAAPRRGRRRGAVLAPPRRAGARRPSSSWPAGSRSARRSS